MKHINISKTATDRLKMKLLNSIQEADIGFRMEVTGDDTSNFITNIRLDKRRAGDEVYEKDGIKIFLDPETEFPLEEYQLDYENGSTNGFIMKTMQEV
jgi:Fe-S cluster assembly iron-binding protein IscA